MGWGSKLWGACKSIAKKAVEVVSKTYDYVAEKASSTWNGITGKSTFDEAETLLNDIKDRYDKAKFEYEKDIKKINISLENKIKTINYHKKDIFNIHFIKFTNLANKLHNLDIDGKHFLEYFNDSISEVQNIQGIRDTSELYAIDFNNLKFSEIAFGILTLGFFTRKKAKQTLIKVKEEEIRVDEEIAKMKSQIEKLKVVEKSIDNVAEYFEILIQNYTKLIDRFEYGIKIQIQQTIVNNNYLLGGKLDFKLMPIVHIEEFQALFNLSIVLKQMATMGYLTDELEILENDKEAVNNLKYKVEQLNILVS
jgi:hypothetical protein